MLNVQYRVLSQPATVWWQGFRSDTYTLQRAGWEIAAEEDVCFGVIRLMLRHAEMNLYALSDDVRWNYHARDERVPEFYVKAVANRFERIVMPSAMTFENFRQIDAAPQMCNREIVNMDDLRIFAAPLVETKELIVDPNKIGDILAQIAQAQLPEQEAIRQRSALRERREGQYVAHNAQPRRTFHAQVLSIAA
jgi:hypothetical protein